LEGRKSVNRSAFSCQGLVTIAAGFAVLACLELLKPLWRKQLKA